MYFKGERRGLYSYTLKKKCAKTLCDQYIQTHKVDRDTRVAIVAMPSKDTWQRSIQFVILSRKTVEITVRCVTLSYDCCSTSGRKRLPPLPEGLISL